VWNGDATGDDGAAPVVGGGTGRPGLGWGDAGVDTTGRGGVGPAGLDGAVGEGAGGSGSTEGRSECCGGVGAMEGAVSGGVGDRMKRLVLASWD
jgi:hypothetical protein